MARPRPALREDCQPLGSRWFADDDLVWPGVPTGPRFGEHLWDVTPLVTLSTMGERTLWFGDLAPAWSLAIRETATFMAQPTHPELGKGAVIWRARDRALGGIVNVVFDLCLIARWATARGMEYPADVTQEDADALLLAMGAGTHRPDGRPLRPGGKRSYVDALRLLEELAPVLTGGGGLAFTPWPGRSSSDVVDLVVPVENCTAPLPWEVWSPTVAAAWAFIDRFSDDVINANQIARGLPKQARGAAGQNAARILAEYLEQGGKVPVHTGFARSPRPRGEVNKTLLAIQLGINDSIFKRANHGYNRELDEFVDDLATVSRAGFSGGSELTRRR